MIDIFELKTSSILFSLCSLLLLRGKFEVFCFFWRLFFCLLFLDVLVFTFVGMLLPFGILFFWIFFWLLLMLSFLIFWFWLFIGGMTGLVVLLGVLYFVLILPIFLLFARFISISMKFLVYLSLFTNKLLASNSFDKISLLNIYS